MKDLVKTLSEFIGFPFEISMEKSKEKEVTVSEEDEEENEEEGWAGSRRPVSLSPCRKTPRCTGGRSSEARSSFSTWKEEQSEFLEERHSDKIRVSEQ